ncbi:hypothetical protein F5141DRAFT_1066470 [Pisolithus sp. B1]|nr:hypothetical protein F5141DRAFT_1066470 [Pisolithus sp. B1]
METHCNMLWLSLWLVSRSAALACNVSPHLITYDENVTVESVEGRIPPYPAVYSSLRWGYDVNPPYCPLGRYHTSYLCDSNSGNQSAVSTTYHRNYIMGTYGKRGIITLLACKVSVAP